jgi:acetylornithine deacetylase/succinyl-diaminopimelate desuccinylase-like protein
MLGLNRPAITYALRGMLNEVIEVRGPASDLHAGTFGGAIHNPAQALCEIVAGLHDTTRRVTIGGFYDQVAPNVPAVPAPTGVTLLREARVAQDWGERGYNPYERTTSRPALTLNGISGGHTGHGTRAIIPARAAARLSFRLVPNQDPLEIDRLFRQHLALRAPTSVRLRVRTGPHVAPVVVDRAHPAVTAAARAYQRVFSTSPVYLRSGGTIPAVAHLQRELGVAPVMMGFGLPGDGTHGPNERLHVPTFFRATDTCIWFLSELASTSHDRRRSLSRR